MSHNLYKECPRCQKETALILSDEELSRYHTYITGEGMIQDVFPDFDAFKREFIKTGYCIGCQCKIFMQKPPKDLSGWKLE